MTAWRAPEPTTIRDLTTWDEVAAALLLPFDTAQIVVVPAGPVLELNGWGLPGAELVLVESDRLSAQDKRRLHRLGLRLEQGPLGPDPAYGCWVWTAPGPDLRLDATTRYDELVPRLARHHAARAASHAQAMAVLRDALRVRPEDLVVDLAAELWPDQDSWDDEDDDWADLG